MDIIITQDSKTGLSDGMQITLNGPELSTAITDFMAKEGAVVSGTPVVFANYEECDNATLVLKTTDRVSLTSELQSRISIANPSVDPVSKSVADWLRGA